MTIASTTTARKGGFFYGKKDMDIANQFLDRCKTFLHLVEQTVDADKDAQIAALKKQVEALTNEKVELASMNAEVAYQLHNMVGFEDRATRRSKRWACVAAGLAMLLVGLIPLLIDASVLLHMVGRPHIYTRLWLMGGFTVIGAALATYGWLRFKR